jgi:arylsulfatase A-like enzyme
VPARKSLVLITVDCLRADHCGFMGYQRPTTPFLDGLAQQSFVFPRAIVAGVPTYYSFPAILASRYPLALGREVLGLAPEEENLASAFQKAGYSTAFFGAGNPYLSARFGYNFGFDIFCDHLNRESVPFSADDRLTEGRLPKRTAAGRLNASLESISHKIPGLGVAYDELYFQYCQRWAAPPAESLDKLRRFPAADVIVDEARTWLTLIGEKPFFLWLHFMDPHAPFYPTNEGLAMFAAPPITPTRARYLNAYWNRGGLSLMRLQHRRDEILSLYDSAIRWVDAQISRLVDVMRGLNRWDNCTLAFTADHGEEFLEHDSRYHPPGLAEELIHVPLLLRVPGDGPAEPKKEVCGNPFGLLHLAPTLLASVELPVPNQFQGTNHFEHLQRGTAWTEPAISECTAGCTNPFRSEDRRGSRLLAVREKRYKLVLNFASATDQLFDLDADPGERSPLPENAARPHRRRLLETALAHLRKSAARQNSDAYLRTRLLEIALDFATLTNSGE